MNKQALSGIISVVTLSIACQLAAAQSPPVKWRVFSNRAGWTIRYPGDWGFYSCHACPDPREADVFVTFYPRQDHFHGAITVLPAPPKSATTSLDAWFAKVKDTGIPTQSSLLSERRWNLNGLPALSVRYRFNNGAEIQNIYVVYEAETFEISFFGKDHASAGEGSYYPTYLQMLSSFSIKRK